MKISDMKGTKAKIINRYAKLAGLKRRPIKAWYSALPSKQKYYATLWLMVESMQLRAKKDIEAEKAASKWKSPFTERKIGELDEYKLSYWQIIIAWFKTLFSRIPKLATRNTEL